MSKYAAVANITKIIDEKFSTEHGLYSYSYNVSILIECLTIIGAQFYFSVMN